MRVNETWLSLRLVSAFVSLALLHQLLPLECLAIEVSLPEPWCDQDKYHVSSEPEGGFSWGTNYGLSSNGPTHEPGEEVSQTYEASTFNVELKDDSCWMACAANMVRYRENRDLYEKWAYTDGITGSWAVPGWDPQPYTTYTFDEGGYMHWCLDAEGLPWAFTWADSRPGNKWIDPMEYIAACLKAGNPVVISLNNKKGNAHGVTVYAIDTDTQALTVTDSDCDPGGNQSGILQYSVSLGGNIIEITSGYSTSFMGNWIPYIGSFDEVGWWTGGTGKWTAAEKWLSDHAPTASQDVYLTQSNIGTVTIDRIAQAKDLYVGNGATVLLEYNGINACTLDTSNVVIGYQSAGLLSVGSATSLTASNLVTVDEDGTLNLRGGTLNALRLNVNGGQLNGLGIVNADVVNAGVLSAGNSPGTIVINGTLTQEETGLLLAKLGGYAASDEYGVVEVTGTATLSGDVDVVTLDLGSGRFRPKRGDSFDILTASHIVDEDLMIAARGFEHEIVAGGQGEVLRISMPEVFKPSVWARATSPAAHGEQEGDTQAVASAECPFPFAPGTRSRAFGDIGSSSDYGLTRATTTLTAHDPIFGDYLTGGADVTTFKSFTVTSNTLPEGTEVTVNIDVSYDGTLQALEEVIGLHSKAYAGCLIELFDELEYCSLAQRRGTAEVIDYAAYTSTSDTGAWSGMLTSTTDGNGNPLYVLDYDETLTFTGVVGNQYWIYFDLATSVFASAGAGWEDFATFAKADFWNTGTYTLYSDADVGFLVEGLESVPEPSTPAVLLGLGAVGLLGSLRRRRN